MANRLAARISEVRLPRSNLSREESNAFGQGNAVDKHIQTQRKAEPEPEVDRARGRPDKLLDIRGDLAAVLRDFARRSQLRLLLAARRRVDPRQSVVRAEPRLPRAWRELRVEDSAARRHRLAQQWRREGWWARSANWPSRWRRPSRTSWFRPSARRSSGRISLRRFSSAPPSRAGGISSPLTSISSGCTCAGRGVAHASQRWMRPFGRRSKPSAETRRARSPVAGQGPVLTGPGRRGAGRVDAVGGVHLAVSFGEQHADEADSLGGPFRPEIQRLRQSDPDTFSYERAASLFGTPHPKLSHSYRSELLRLPLFPTMMRYSSRILAESWESTNLYWAALPTSFTWPRRN